MDNKQGQPSCRRSESFWGYQAIGLLVNGANGAVGYGLALLKV